MGETCMNVCSVQIPSFILVRIWLLTTNDRLGIDFPNLAVGSNHRLLLLDSCQGVLF
jgi:hypothetical protein